MGAAAQGGNKRAGAPSLLPGGRWAAVLAGAVMLAQCTASSAAADPTVRPVTAAELGASWHPGCPVEPGNCDGSTSTTSVSTAKPTGAS